MAAARTGARLAPALKSYTKARRRVSHKDTKVGRRRALRVHTQAQPRPGDTSMAPFRQAVRQAQGTGVLKAQSLSRGTPKGNGDRGTEERRSGGALWVTISGEDAAATLFFFAAFTRWRHTRRHGGGSHTKTRRHEGGGQGSDARNAARPPRPLYSPPSPRWAELLNTFGVPGERRLFLQRSVGRALRPCRL